jgi:hypothetical protein
VRGLKRHKPGRCWSCLKLIGKLIVFEAFVKAGAVYW